MIQNEYALVKPISVIQNECASLWYHPDRKIVHHKIHKFIESKAFRELLTTGAEYLEKHHAVKWLSDDTNSVVIRDDDSHWADTVWRTRVMRAGFKYWAIVMPTAAIGQLNMRRYAKAYKALGVTVRLFDNPDAALSWLASM